MSALGLLEMAAKMHALEKDLDKALQATIETAAGFCLQQALAVVGTYTLGWESLAPSTLAHKPADTPLLETGRFRDSITASIGHHEATVGSDDKKATFFEFGTSRMPARPIFGPLAVAAETVIKQAAAVHVKRALAGRGPSMHGLHEFMELLHLAKEVLQGVRELAPGEGRR